MPSYPSKASKSGKGGKKEVCPSKQTKDGTKSKTGSRRKRHYHQVTAKDQPVAASNSNPTGPRNSTVSAQPQVNPVPNPVVKFTKLGRLARASSSSTPNAIRSRRARALLEYRARDPATLPQLLELGRRPLRPRAMFGSGSMRNLGPAGPCVNFAGFPATGNRNAHRGSSFNAGVAVDLNGSRRYSNNSAPMQPRRNSAPEPVPIPFARMPLSRFGAQPGDADAAASYPIPAMVPIRPTEFYPIHMPYDFPPPRNAAQPRIIPFENVANPANNLDGNPAFSYAFREFQDEMRSIFDSNFGSQ